MIPPFFAKRAEEGRQEEGQPWAFEIRIESREGRKFACSSVL